MGKISKGVLTWSWAISFEFVFNTVKSSKLFQIGDETQSREQTRNSRSSKLGNLTQETELRELFQPRSQCSMSKSFIVAHKVWVIIYFKDNYEKVSHSLWPRTRHLIKREMVSFVREPVSIYSKRLGPIEIFLKLIQYLSKPVS